MKEPELTMQLQAQGLTPTHVVGGGKYAMHGLYIDETNRKWCSNNLKDDHVVVRSFEDILDVRMEDQYDQKTRGGGGTSLLGAAMFGVTGAVVGSALGTKTTKQQLKSRHIIVTLNSFSNSVLKIDAGPNNQKVYAAFQAMRSSQQH